MDQKKWYKNSDTYTHLVRACEGKRENFEKNMNEYSLIVIPVGNDSRTPIILHIVDFKKDKYLLQKRQVSTSTATTI